MKIRVERVKNIETKESVLKLFFERKQDRELFYSKMKQSMDVITASIYYTEVDPELWLLPEEIKMMEEEE
jgi:hypothetical protein